MGNIDELVESLAKDAASVRPAPHPFMLSAKWLLAAAAYLALSLALSGLRPDVMHKLGDPWFVAEIVALVLLLGASSLSAALLAFPDLHQMRKVAFAPAAMFALFILTIFLAWRADVPPAPPPVHSIECTIDITLLSLLPAAWVFFSLRKFASTHYQWAGSIALLGAFSVGALWLRLHELNDSIMHVIQWHYLPMLGIGLIGLWLGKALLKW